MTEQPLTCTFTISRGILHSSPDLRLVQKGVMWAELGDNEDSVAA